MRSLAAGAVRRMGGPLGHARVSFAQEAEDLVLDRMFPDGCPNIYVDIGAHHPFRFSNTYIFYRRGWRGTNVDANPGSIHAFRGWRRRDVLVSRLGNSCILRRLVRA